MDWVRRWPFQQPQWLKHCEKCFFTTFRPKMFWPFELLSFNPSTFYFILDPIENFEFYPIILVEIKFNPFIRKERLYPIISKNKQLGHFKAPGNFRMVSNGFHSNHYHINYMYYGVTEYIIKQPFIFWPDMKYLSCVWLVLRAYQGTSTLRVVSMVSIATVTMATRVLV